jgi:hypothetical protein
MCFNHRISNFVFLPQVFPKSVVKSHFPLVFLPQLFPKSVEKTQTLKFSVVKMLLPQKIIDQDLQVLN